MLKKMTFSVILLVALSLFGMETNWIVNPGFETLDSRNQPIGWFLNIGENKELVDDQGNTVLKMSAVWKHAKNRVSIATKLAALPQGSYRFSGRLKGDFEDICFVFVFTGNPMPQVKTIARPAMKKLANDWYEFSHVLTLPAATAGASLALDLFCSKAGDTVFYDDILLVKTSDTVSAAAVVKPAAAASPAGTFIPLSDNQFKLSEELVAKPSAAALVSWPRLVIAGQDYWQMLSEAWFSGKLGELSKEPFVQNAGLHSLDSVFFRKKNLQYPRLLILNEIEVYQNGSNTAGKCSFHWDPKESETDLSFMEHVNDGRNDTSAYIAGDPRSSFKRNTLVSVLMQIRLPSAEPVSKIRILSGLARTGEAALDGIHYSGPGTAKTEKTPEGMLITFDQRPPQDSITLELISQKITFSIDLNLNPALAESLKTKAFSIHPPFRGASLFGLSEKNLDTASIDSFLSRYQGLFLGFDIGEWDSNYLQFKRGVGGYYGYHNYFDRIPDKDRYEAEKNFQQLYALHDAPCYGLFMPHSGALGSQQYAAEYGSTASNIQNSTERPAFNHRYNTLIGRGAARQYGIPWGTYLAYHVGSYIPGDRTRPDLPMGLHWGASPAFTRRYFYYQYYMGALFQQYESQGGMYTLDPASGRYSLTKNGEALKDMYEWSRDPRGVRGDAYAPVLLLADYHHGHFYFDTYRPWCVWRNSIPFQDGDYMMEHFIRSISNPENTAMDKPPYNVNLINSKIGEIFDCYFANPPSGVISRKELASYPVVILVDDVKFTPGLIKNLKDYVHAGGTLLLNSLHLKNFAEAPEFCGIERLPGETRLHGMKLPNIRPLTALPAMQDAGGQVLMTKNRFGSGNVLVTLPHCMLMENPQQTNPLIEKILLGVQNEVAPVQVDGDVLFLYNRMPDGVWKVILINGKGISKAPGGSTETIHPEYAARVRLSVPAGAVCTAVELKTGNRLKAENNGFELVVPPGDIRIVDVSGIDFESDRIALQDTFKRTPVGVDLKEISEKQNTDDINPERGLILEYNFDDGNGEIVKDSGAAKFDLAATGTSYVKKRTGYAMRFTGENQSYLTGKFPGHVTSSMRSIPEGTVEIWTKPDMESGAQPMKSRRGELFCTTQMHATISNGRWVFMLVPQSSPVLSVQGPPARHNQWQQILITWKDFTARVYVDGKEYISASGRMIFPLPIFNNSANLFIGSHYYQAGSQPCYNGLVDSFRLFGSSFSHEEIQQRFSTQKLDYE